MKLEIEVKRNGPRIEASALMASADGRSTEDAITVLMGKLRDKFEKLQGVPTMKASRLRND